ncbi:MAG TPA: maleylpyruvate isomerase family mycothiol-dependent enzyme [Acidimicrobiales bacterium]|nr:maleylpyruvate isomerase family mycothiol-dependent enzyme [Acidimicrobiales bacterium]
MSEASGEPVANDEPNIRLLDEVWASIDELGAGLGETEWKTPSELPGWSVQDNLSHIVGTERTMRGEPTPDNDPPADHVRNPIGELNEHWVERYRTWSGAELLAEFDRLRAERLAELRALPPERFDEVGPTPVGEAPFREFLAVRVFDSWIHEQDMRRALARPGHLTGPVVELSMRRMATAMPYVVGKKVGAPDRTTVVFDITAPDGTPVTTVAVAVDGRAALVEPPPDPDVRLRLDLVAFTALSTGRWDPATALADGVVAFEGDDALGRHVVEQMNFMV